MPGSMVKIPMAINQTHAGASPVSGRSLPGGIAILFTGNHHRRGGTRRPEIALLLIEANTYRHPLRQTHPFKVRINRGHPFCIAAAAGIGDPCSNAVDGAFKGLYASQRGNFSTKARAHALKLGLFQIGHDIEGILLHQRNAVSPGDKLAV
jgi:hypothetical protein